MKLGDYVILNRKFLALEFVKKQKRFIGGMYKIVGFYNAHDGQRNSPIILDEFGNDNSVHFDHVERVVPDCKIVRALYGDLDE